MGDPRIARRISRAAETNLALTRVTAERSTENVAALHRLHARHMREDGDLLGARRAEARAKHVEGMARRDSRPAGA